MDRRRRSRLAQKSTLEAKLSTRYVDPASEPQAYDNQPSQAISICVQVTSDHAMAKHWRMPPAAPSKHVAAIIGIGYRMPLSASCAWQKICNVTRSKCSCAGAEECEDACLGDSLFHIDMGSTSITIDWSSPNLQHLNIAINVFKPI